MKKIIDFVLSKTSLIKVIILFLIFIIIAFLINSDFIGLAKLHSITGGHSIPDMSFYNTPSQVHEILNALGEDGRLFYLQNIIPLDFIFPIAYSAFLLFSLSLLYKKIFVKAASAYWLLLLPLLTGIFDYSENISNLVLLLNYPGQIIFIALLSGIFCALKMFFFVASFLLLFIGLISLIIKGITKKA